MKRLFVLVSLVAIVTAGATYAEDQPGPVVDKSVAVDAADESSPAVDEPEATDAEDQPGADREESEKKGEKPRTDFGLLIGVYNPTDSSVKDVFGDNWLRLGLRPMRTRVPNRWVMSYDLSYYSMSNNGHRATLIPLTAGVMHGFGKDEKRQMYVAVHAGPYYGRVRAPLIGVHKSGWGLNVNTTLAVVFDKRFLIEARYEFMDDFAGLDFSAFTLSAAFKVFSARF